jgi:NAD(P)-dependent dehydrogenase (short-subunit alcohol dehydrogenase family)
MDEIFFVVEGAKVFITGRRQRELDEAAKAIGDNLTGVQGDVSKLPDLDRVYETVNAEGKRMAPLGLNLLALFGDAAQRSLLSSVAIRLSR